MKNRLFSILIALFIGLTFAPSSFAQNLQDDPQQGDLLDGVKVHPGKVNIHDVKFSPDGTRLAVATTRGILAPSCTDR
jgi:hypothetical protein